MAGLRHPAVVQFLGVSLDPPMLVTEYCERGSLFNVVYNMRFSAPETISTGFDWRRRLSLALDAALGMEFLVRGDVRFMHVAAFFHLEILFQFVHVCTN